LNLIIIYTFFVILIKFEYFQILIVFILLILKISVTLNYKINTVNNTYNCNKSSKITTKSSFNTITKITEKTEIHVKILLKQ